MSYLLHGSTGHTGMGWVDRVPRAGALFIGGLYALYQTDLIRAAGITHVVSVIDYDASLREKFPHLQQLHIRADDHPNEDLLQHLAAVVEWIETALNDGGAVFVHCAMGKSRSATLVVAYLMWKSRIDVNVALSQLCEGRPVCQPNPGFMEQLEIWGRMVGGTEAEQKELYAEWERERFRGEYWEWEKRADHARIKARL